MAILDEIRNPLERVLQSIKKDRTLLCRDQYPKSTGRSDTRITAENLLDLAGNHLFDDHPEWFEITKHEGLAIRAYLLDGQVRGHYAFVPELHAAFPNHLETERREFSTHINEYRQKQGLEKLAMGR